MVNRDDRRFKQNGSWTGGTDAAEAREFADYFCKPCNFTEWLQPVLTHECGKARSKLDTVFSNHTISDQLDRAYGCVALPKVPCSAHRPVAFSRKAPEPAGPSSINIDAAMLSDPQFAHRVALEFHELQHKDERRSTPFRNLVLMKRAIGAVAITCRHTEHVNDSSSKEDDLGHVLSFLRAAERVNLQRMQECSKKYPKISDFVHAGDP